MDELLFSINLTIYHVLFDFCVKCALEASVLLLLLLFILMISKDFFIRLSMFLSLFLTM